MTIFNDWAKIYIAIALDPITNLLVCKVGQSKNPLKRARGLSTASGRPTQILLESDFCSRSEAKHWERCLLSAAHEKGFNSYEGEWIDGKALPRLIEWFKALKPNPPEPTPEQMLLEI